MHLFALGIFFGHYICHISDRIQGGHIYLYKYIYVYTYEFVRMGIVLRAVAKSRKSRGLKPQWYVYQTPNTFPTETKKTPEILMKCALNPWPNFRGGTYPGFIASTTIAFNRVSMLRESRCINGIYGNCVSCNSNSAQQKHAQTNYILSREYRELSWRNRVSTNYWIPEKPACAERSLVFWNSTNYRCWFWKTSFQKIIDVSLFFPFPPTSLWPSCGPNLSCNHIRSHQPLLVLDNSKYSLGKCLLKSMDALTIQNSSTRRVAPLKHDRLTHRWPERTVCILNCFELDTGLKAKL